ncbi:transposase [Streptomyces sp. NPDC020898]|uniref:transposase n=1 Tax=Streptomyces sp. NPDC020898 TaxID=3365101 RepID=UPI003792E1F9
MGAPEDRVLWEPTYRRTILTLRQLAPLFGIFEELPLLHQPPSRHRRGHSPGRRGRRALARQDNRLRKQVRARVEHVFGRMKTWKILHDCRLKWDGVHHAILDITRPHHLNLAGQTAGSGGSRPHHDHVKDHLGDSPEPVNPSETRTTTEGLFDHAATQAP